MRKLIAAALIAATLVVGGGPASANNWDRTHFQTPYERCVENFRPTYWPWNITRYVWCYFQTR